MWFSVTDDPIKINVWPMFKTLSGLLKAVLKPLSLFYSHPCIKSKSGNCKHSYLSNRRSFGIPDDSRVHGVGSFLASPIIKLVGVVYWWSTVVVGWATIWEGRSVAVVSRTELSQVDFDLEVAELGHPRWLDVLVETLLTSIPTKVTGILINSINV